MSDSPEAVVILRPTIALSWRPANEFDEVEDALKLIAQEGTDEFTANTVVAEHVTDPSPSALLSALEALLKRCPGATTLYLTCHGSERGLHFTDRGPDEPLPYAELLGPLAKFDGARNGLTLAMGSCFAAEVFKPVLNELPKFVRRFVGFTHKPSARQVGQMLASIVVGDDKTLFGILAKAAHACDASLTKAFRRNDVAHVEAIFRQRQQAVEEVLQGFVAEAGRLVRAESEREQRETGFLLDYRRQDDGSWREVDD